MHTAYNNFFCFDHAMASAAAPIWCWWLNLSSHDKLVHQDEKKPQKTLIYIFWLWYRCILTSFHAKDHPGQTIYSDEQGSVMHLHVILNEIYVSDYACTVLSYIMFTTAVAYVQPNRTFRWPDLSASVWYVELYTAVMPHVHRGVSKPVT